MEITFPNFRKLTKMEGPSVIKLGSPKIGKVHFERTFCQGRWLKIALIFFEKLFSSVSKKLKFVHSINKGNNTLWPCDLH
jgi:hypothetical protein